MLQTSKLFFITALTVVTVSLPLWAQDSEDSDSSEDSEPISSKEIQKNAPKPEPQKKEAAPRDVRRFHEVLDELLAEFGYDVKMGQIKGLSNLAIRKVRVSQAIPKTYEDYVENLLTERIRDNSSIRLITCVPCKSRSSSVVDGKLMISSPTTNLAKLETAAAQLGIENFMDAVLVYHTSHMVLAINVFNAKTKETTWVRTYNSETIKSRYQKLAVDYSQVEKSRPGEDYVPEYRIMIGLGGAGIPNVGGSKDDSSMLAIAMRATEKFNNRKNEFGLGLTFFKTTNSLLNTYPTEGGSEEETSTIPDVEEKSTTPTPKAFQHAIMLHAMYQHMFLGKLESYNELRHGIHFGLGAMLATGYLAPTVRVGWDIFTGRRFTTTLEGDYVMASRILINGKTVKTKGGGGGELIFSFNY